MADLNALYDLLESSTLYSATNKLFSYSKSNPAEAAAVEVYWRNGGTRPAAATKFGKFLLDVVDQLRPAIPPPPPPTTTGLLQWDATAQAQARGSWTPLRTVTVNTHSEWTSAWNNLRDGDRVIYQAPPLYGSAVWLMNKQVATRAEIIGLKHAGGVWPGVYRCAEIYNLARIHFYDYDISRKPSDGETGMGWLLDGCQDVSWWGVTHDCPSGGGGHYNTGAGLGSNRVDLRGEVINCATPAGDFGHPDEPGTGDHGFYLGGSPGFTDNSVFSYSMRDIHAGAGLQCGHHIRNSKIYLSVVTNDAPRPSFYVAGNALQFWGDYIENITVEYIYGENCNGRVIEGDGIYGSVADGAITVKYGRGKNCLLDLRNGLPNPDRYFDISDAAIKYVDISPL